MILFGTIFYICQYQFDMQLLVSKESCKVTLKYGIGVSGHPHKRARAPLILWVPETKIGEFANSVDLDEVAQDELPHLDLHYLPSSL